MELNGNGFKLRTWQATDALSLQKNADNRNVSAYLLDRFPSPYTLKDADDFIRLKMKESPPTNFAIDINGEAAGVIGLDFREDVYRKTPLIGYWLSEQYWGRGIMPQAVKLITNYGFAELDIICIQAGILGGNAASMRVLEKAGYTKQGILKNSVIKHTVVMDEHIYTTNGPLT
ncbi:GNAT family N-acetyltransferase [Mucilaginibacter segetis]|uniref:GNAT family N-acetyltransferase n=1 Tax=Mucilaginibacter segetis TaxID=2793071 RepID=A0A934PVS2_9SPHI|nr:GNAT family protein [Mucilaginibacter segetis]MBK0380310.1 GNAT family N-acetyltransferase [Mucilaginibacter segetis]